MKETTSDNRQSTEHLIVLDKIKEAMEVDKNALAMWVFGSVAKGSYHQGSDIDLGIVYKDFAPNYEFSTGFVDDIKVGFSRWSEDKLKHNSTHAPYRGYVFAHATVLFDKIGVRQYQQDILDYLKAHPEVQQEWDKYNALYEREKREYGEGKTSIFTVYKELDEKFGQIR